MCDIVLAFGVGSLHGSQSKCGAAYIVADTCVDRQKQTLCRQIPETIHTYMMLGGTHKALLDNGKTLNKW